LQRSYNAWLIYNSNEDTFGGGEKSRYISQLEWELPARGIYPIPLKVDEGIHSNGIQPIEIAKDRVIVDKLLEKAKKGFSFSSLKTYINCSLSFYYTYILGLEEVEEVEEDISVRTMGTILHEVLEDLYKPFLGKLPDESTLKNALLNAENLIAQKTALIFPALRVNTGKNLLFMKVAETWLKRFVKNELTSISDHNAPILKGVELALKHPLLVEVQGLGNIDITLYGKIDRVDLKDGILRVIDYKTGKVEEKDVKAQNLDDLFNPNKKTDKQLQLLLYKYLAEHTEDLAGYPIQPGLLSFRSLNKGFMTLESNIQATEFESGLKSLFQEIFNTEIPFKQTDPKHCNYCNFKQICQRN
jgi:ATP-dependent helicase/DNAse subunit B